jgi:iron complex outermembrane receptor protein
VFDMPAGALASRSASSTAPSPAYDSPDALITSGNTTGNVAYRHQGGYSLDEAYLELAIPVSGRPAVRQAARLQRRHPLLGLQQLR